MCDRYKSLDKVVNSDMKKKKPKIRGYAAREKGRKGLVLFRNQKGVVKGNRLLTHPCFGFLPNFKDAVNYTGTAYANEE